MRARVSRNSYLSDIERHFYYHCFIRDASKTGCRVYSTDAQDFPDYVWLFPQNIPRPMLGRVAWRQRHMVGIHFVADPLTVPGVTAAHLAADEMPSFDKIHQQLAKRSDDEHKPRQPAAAHRQKGSLDVVRDYVATVVHELRTPITSISGALALVYASARSMLPAKIVNMVSVAIRNTKRIEHLVSNLLNAEKLKRGKLEITMTPDDLNAVATDVVTMDQSFAAMHKVTCRVETLAGRAMVRIDRHWIEQVLTNLISNAAKFSQPDQEVVVRVERVGDAIRLSVIDHGAGIAKDAQARIFDRFEQADPGSAGAAMGTGLGLGICKSILSRHGSRIQLQSEPGKGSVFWFELPEIKGANPAKRSP